MSNQKLKSELYTGLGGINVKFSPYVMGPMEFLDIQNMDFQTPGALTQRWGSTMYLGQTLVGKITALGEFARISGPSYVFFGGTGALYFGATTGLSQGMSFLSATAMALASSQYVAGEFIDYVYADGAPLSVLAENPAYLGLDRLRLYQFITYNFFGQTNSANVLNYAILNNYLFACDGNKFFKTDGITTSFVGLPPPLNALWNATVYAASGPTSIGCGVLGSYGFYGSWVNQRGFESQIWPIANVNATQANSASLGGTFVLAQGFIPIPRQHDVQSLNIYSYYSSSSLSIGSTTFWNNPYVFRGNYPIATAATLVVGSSLTFGAPLDGMTFLVVNFGSTVGGQTAMRLNTGEFPDPITNSYFPLGFTLMANGNSATPGSPGGNLNEIRLTSFHPQYITTYQNRLFLAGFSTAPSTVVYSDTGEPEGFPQENSFEVRTNDADVVTAMKSYLSRLYIFKKNSFHVLSGDNNQNFVIQEVSANYGCLNNRSVITFDEVEKLMFLDRKGLVMFNGAQLVHVSLKMQPYFDRMNYAAALTEACLVHDKLRNQVMCAIPIDGSSINNIVIVFDYAANSWTTQFGVAPSIFAEIQGRNNTKNVFYGSYSGMISWYGSSFTSDSGVGFTCLIKPRFNHEMGDTIQKQFRRLYVNMDQPGSTLKIPVNFFQDYGSSKVLQSTFVIGEFQNRLEYGISAKAVTFELYHAAQTVPIRIYGYTLEERLQRKV